MLVLAHADGLGVDFHQFGQGILHATGDGNGAALGHVEIREFRRGLFAGGVHGSAGFADDHIGHAGQIGQQGSDELLAFPAGGAVADGDGGHMVLLHHALDQPGALGLGHLLARQSEMAHAGFQHLAVFVHHGQLAARAEAGVHAQGHLALDGRLHQQLVQVLGKHPDGLLVGPVGELIADFPLQRGEEQAFPGVRAGQGHLVGGLAAGAHKGLVHFPHAQFIVDFQRYLQEFFPFAAVDGQDAVGRHAGNRLGIIVVHAVHTVFFLGGLGFDNTLAQQQGAQGLAHRRVIADGFGDDVPGAGQRRFGVRHFLAGIHVLFRFFFRVGLGQLQQQPQGQRLQPPLLGDGGPGAALGPVWAVQILQLGQGLGPAQLVLQFVCQHVHIRQGFFDFLAAFVQIAQVFQPLRQFAQHLVVQGAMGLLAVPGDEGNGVARVQQLDHGLYLLGTQGKFLGKQRGKIHVMFPPYSLFSGSYSDKKPAKAPRRPARRPARPRRCPRTPAAWAASAPFPRA